MNFWLDPPLNILITGPTGCGKSMILLKLLLYQYLGKFDYILLLCPTYINNATYDIKEIYNDKDFIVTPTDHDTLDNTLKIVQQIYQNSNTLIIIDDCASSQYVKNRTSELVRLAFSSRHDNISVWVLTQQYTSISKAFRENIGMLVLFYLTSKIDMKNIMNEYGNIIKDDIDSVMDQLKVEQYSFLVLRLKYPYSHKIMK